MTEYLIDSDVLIHHLQGQKQAVAFLKAHWPSSAVSFINIAEVLSFPYTSAQEKTVRQFLDSLHRYGLNKQIMESTIRLRREYRIKLPDAFVAATAICYDLTLASCNLKDFQKTGVRLLDPLAHSL